MSKTKRTKKIGLSPGSLIHIGESKSTSVKIEVISYSESDIFTEKLVDAGECARFKDSPAITWINITGVHDTDVIEKVGKIFGIHPLVLEDIVNTEQRPKIDFYEDYAYVVLKMLAYNQTSNDIDFEQVSLLVGKNYVISFLEDEGDVFGNIRDRIKVANGRHRKLGSDYLAYSLIDAIVDHYFIILEKTGEYIEVIEEELLDNPKPEVLSKINRLRYSNLFLRKSIWPLRELLNSVQRSESPVFTSAIEIYLKDVYDHTIQIIETAETYRDMTSGMIDIYLSSISNKMNSIMKVLTIIATIFIPLTFVVGIYGMNFKYMPELEWRYGYLFIWLVMLAIAVVMIFFFRRKKWM